MAALAALAAWAALAAGSTSAWAKGAPIPHQVSNDFKSYIIQGERPEIAACMAAGFNALRHDHRFQHARWSPTTSDTAVMHETEQGDHIVRRMSLNAQAIVTGSSFFDVWVDIKVDCMQRDEGYPVVSIVAPG